MLLPLILLLLGALLALGIPVAFSLAIAGSAGLAITSGFDSLFTILSTAPYRTVASFTLTTVPMFILMAELASNGNLAGPLFTLATRWLGHRRGGVGISVVFAGAGFGAVCGSSIAAAAAISRIAVPEMIKVGYARGVAAGIVAVAGTLAIMIPPSVPLIIYGITTETSIGKLLIAGIIPGILTALVYSVGISAWARGTGGTMPTLARASWRQRTEALRGIWPFLVLVLLVVVGIYSGVATASEVASLGALGALGICAATRSIDTRGVLRAVERTVLATAMIFTIIIGAMIFGYFLTITQASQALIQSISSSGIPPWSVMLALIVLYLVLGCFLDQIAILLITLPLTFPLVTQLGYDEIWFGIIVVKLVEIGLVTPPLGMNAFVVSGQTGVPLGEVFRGIGMMLTFEFMTLILLLAFPILSTYLPSLMI
ncbi:MAG: TRAP transporter large permease [Burkholderiaceae bacterium]|nr:TRAP transporter large permease [Burkholderiaceae bacterium]